MKPAPAFARPESQVDLPRTELPAEGREQYLNYVIAEIEAKFKESGKVGELFEVKAEIAPTGRLQIFGIEITAFTSRQEEVDLITRLRERGFDAKLYQRPGKSTFPPLYWFLVKQLPAS